jgi:hypothetical protein
MFNVMIFISFFGFFSFSIFSCVYVGYGHMQKKIQIPQVGPLVKIPNIN